MTNLAASSYVGRLAICRVHEGTIRAGAERRLVPRRRHDRPGQGHRALRHRGARPRDRPTAPVPERSSRSPACPRSPSARRWPTWTTRVAAPRDRRGRAEPLAHRRHQHVAPRGSSEGKFVTARQVSDRLQQELVGNVSLRVLPTERPDAWEVQGRGELQLAVLVETMRREGFELTVGKPQVLTREIDGDHLRAARARLDRRPRGLPRRRHPDARPAQGPPGADRQPRHRLGAHGVPAARPRPGGLPHRVPHRDPRHRPPAPRVRPLGALDGRDPHPSARQPDRRPLGL